MDSTSGACIFISCGQNSLAGELQIAEKIAQELTSRGFEPYIAGTQQTLRGLKENIFEKLRDAEYFLFVDFMREPLAGVSPLLCRGSVFTQQELAIAAYNETEVIAFQESGVKRLEGVLAFLQTNTIPFTDRSTLPVSVVAEVERRKWDPTWRNELELECPAIPSRSAMTRIAGTDQTILGHFFSLQVTNRHRSKDARNTYGYLDEVIDAKSGKRVEFDTAELKWGGYTLPNARIPPGKSRKLDAFWIPEPVPTAVQFNIFTDSSHYVPQVKGPGEWILTYSVASDTVPGTTRAFRLCLDGTVQGITFQPL